MKWYIKHTTMYGLQVVKAFIRDTTTGLITDESVHMSESGARAWLLHKMT